MQQSKQADPWVRNHLIRDAIGQAIYEEMEKDESIHLFGEGAEVKQHYDAPQIEKTFPDRIHTLPISEDGNVNFAVGASLLGVTPIIDIITSDFLFRAMDSICNTATKLDFVSPGRTIVIRSEFLLAGPTTGQRLEAFFTHIPGLNVVIPSTPRDAYGLMRTALNTPGVTLFFEDRMIKDDLLDEPDCRMDSPIGFGFSMTRFNSGLVPKVTIVTYGLMRQVVETAYDNAFPALRGTIDLIDLRTIYPIDWTEIKASVRKSGKLLIIEPDVQYGGVGAEIAATVAEWNVHQILQIKSDSQTKLIEGDPFLSGSEIPISAGEQLITLTSPPIRIKRIGGVREIAPANKAGLARMLPTESEIIDAINSFN